jgi:WD40 repeat protein
MKVKHEGEVNRARYMPQNHFVVASRGPSPEVYIFDRTKHPSIPQANDPFSPQGVCVGHTEEGYGLVWSPHQEGHLCTASADKTVKVWDVSACTAAKSTPGTQIHPLVSLGANVHTAGVEDVDWHAKDASMIASVGDDKQLVLWDVRKPDETIHVVKDAHQDDINAVAFNPFNEYLVATGSSDNDIAVWDLRKLTSRLQTLSGHTNDVYRIEWAPHNESILASCSADRRVAVWDLSRIGMEQSPEDAEDGPPELLFLHGGHTSKVSDFTWSPVAEWGIASVSEDNVLQVWHMAEDVYAEEGDDEENDGKQDNGALNDDDLE